jgi:hypothetical protein
VELTDGLPSVSARDFRDGQDRGRNVLEYTKFHSHRLCQLVDLNTSTLGELSVQHLIHAMSQY